ncbi:Universal stress protein family [Mycobacteroides abscessus subsp. bolletii]|uniref:universal stress protein n=1 Tax=Mycobacteroides abscessus TaxID=36809 RepID=UPI0009A8882B|nr:universal stress protein [Mycobacteroides abscessus]SLI54411.1 Universal stress protein family [Mycobacteroides abscessus subsp. bolletii]
MRSINQDRPVIVGIDGSCAALSAAEFAVDEAIIRDVPLRLVYVVNTMGTTSFNSSDQHERRFAETSLRTAVAVIESTGKPVKIDTVRIGGRPSGALAVESRSASMICVGTGQLTTTDLGSTAIGIAEQAFCPVLIVRKPHLDQASDLAALENLAEGRSWKTAKQKWIAVSINGSRDNRNVVDHAMREARLRRLPVLAVSTWPQKLPDGMHHELDRRVARLREHYRDVHIYPVTTHARICRFVGRCHEPIALTVIGSAESKQAAWLCASSADTGSSLLVVRQR